MLLLLNTNCSERVICSGWLYMLNSHFLQALFCSLVHSVLSLKLFLHSFPETSQLPIPVVTFLFLSAFLRQESFLIPHSKESSNDLQL